MTRGTEGALSGQVAFRHRRRIGLGARSHAGSRRRRDGDRERHQRRRRIRRGDRARRRHGRVRRCDSAAFDAEIDKAVERHGRLDIMINNAGMRRRPTPNARSARSRTR
ncbi:MAG: hypothetical protein R2713_16510 [Ilumatobacteraceae bacterium]